MMEHITHTPGPWEVFEHLEANHHTITANNDWLIVTKQNGQLMPEKQKANARLIAAAPELLEATKEFVKMWSEVRMSDEEVFAVLEKAKSAIEKATQTT